MQTLGQLSHALGQSKNIEAVLKEIAVSAESHYLVYFMNNLSFEITTFYGLLAEDTQGIFTQDNEALAKIIQNITKAWNGSAKWLNPTKRSVSMKLSTLYKYRETLANQVAVLAAYDDKLKMFQYILTRRKDYSTVAETVTDDALAGELIEFIFEYEDSMSVNDRVKGIYGELPVRMSKLKFHEWIEKALIGMKGVSVKDLANYIDYLKETFYPEGVKGYGEVTPDFYKELKELDVLMTDIVAADVVAVMEEKIAGLQMMLDDSVSLYTFTASVINNMIGILSVLNDESLKNKEEDVAAFIKIMDTLYSRRNEEEIIDEALVADFDTITLQFNESMMNNGKYNSLIDDAKQSYVDSIVELGLNDRYDRLATLYILQSSSYFAPVKVNAEDLVMVDEKKLIEFRNDLMAYLDDAGKENTRIEKRARIANVFSVLNVVHGSAQEIHAYILSALGGCRDEREKQGCIMILRDLMDDVF